MNATTQRILLAIERAEHEGMLPIERTYMRIAKRAHVSHQTASKRLRALHDAGVLHVDAWPRGGLAGRLSAAYAIGPGEDAPYPEWARRIDYTSSPTGQIILKAMQDGLSGTREDVAAACECSGWTAEEILRQMHQAKVIFVAGWRRNTNGPSSPVFAIRRSRRQADAPRPAPQGVTERRNRRKAELREAFGDEIAEQIMRCMYRDRPRGTTVVVDGRAVYRKGQGILVDLAEVRSNA